MPCITYVHKDFQPKTMALIERANAIIAEYQAQGYKLTLRQLYYQFVARGLLANVQRNYKRLGSILSDARLAGLVDWDAIEDRTRNLDRFPTWQSPESIVEAVAQQFRLDLWADQANRVEVWVEKEALAGVVGQIAERLRIDCMACRGYMSQSEMWDAAIRRFADYQAHGQAIHLLHLGDHDPSGIDMTRDIGDRLALFLDEPISLTRLALNMDQVEEHQPPPNPAKVTDSRYEGYAILYGEESWELDALEPTTLDALITGAVDAVRDDGLWEVSLQREQEDRARLRVVADQWSEVCEFLDNV